MINREDMLALTRRMTVKRTSITRIAGGYMDIDGFIDGTFNTSFLKLNPVEQEKNLALAKKVPFAKTNKNLKEYKFWRHFMRLSGNIIRQMKIMQSMFFMTDMTFRRRDWIIYVRENQNECMNTFYA